MTDEAELANLRFQVRYYRMERGWAQDYLSYEAGLNKSTVSHLERGDSGVGGPRVKTAIIVAGCLGKTLAEMLADPTDEQRAQMRDWQSQNRRSHADLSK